ncbi:MAG TPA: class I SAM-dependent methyltransferase [Candidatus Saccharimonadales bacterium]|nr:class I SAM-dependent methyltransferase [Candidatus Saccharimonadales bacterium]
MLHDALNHTYWQRLPAKAIPGNNIFPGNELTSQLQGSASILDVGCGSGEMIERLAGQGFSATGIDINAETIAKHTTNPSPVRYILGSATDLPFAENTFDAVIFGFVLVNLIPEHKRQKAISEAYRVLRPGGVIWINEGLTSPDYAKRYKLCRGFIDDGYSFFVFKESGLSAAIKTKEDCILRLRKTWLIEYPIISPLRS